MYFQIPLIRWFHEFFIQHAIKQAKSNALHTNPWLCSSTLKFVKTRFVVSVISGLLTSARKEFKNMQIRYKYSDEIKAEDICFLRREFPSKCSINSTSIFFFDKNSRIFLMTSCLLSNKYQIFLSAKEMNMKLLQNKNSDCNSSQKSSRLHLRAWRWFGTNFQVQTTSQQFECQEFVQSKKMHFKQLV